MKFKIVYVDNIPQGFIGMNYYASKELGIPFPHKKNLIWILKGMPEGRTRRTINHEKTEATLMKMRKYPYHKAHIIANETEDLY